MKKYGIIFLLLLISNQITGQQTRVKKAYYLKALKEQVFVHYNTSLLLSGEDLYYKVYCIRERSKKLSNLSKVAYVSLIDSNSKKIITQKIRLKNGVGSGVYHVPSTLLTGHYKLVAYTQWMRNEGSSYFFKGDLAIVNLFKENQNLSFTSKDSLNASKYLIIKKSPPLLKEQSTNGNISIVVNKNKFKPREKGNITLVNKKEFYGNYSLSVRKVDSLTLPKQPTVVNYVEEYPADLEKNYKKEALFIPEFKGGVLIGKIVSIKTKEPIANTKVVMSVPDKKYKFRFAVTDASGTFKFIFKKPNSDKKIWLQIVDSQKEKYKIIVDKKIPFTPQNLHFKELKIAPNTRETLLKRHVYSQIEVNYRELKNDSIQADPYLDYEMLNNTTTYLLDDYHRFATVKETILEYIKNVWITKRKGKYTFHVRNIDAYDEVKLLPLVIIDGIIIQNHEEAVNLETSEIKSISVLRNKLYYGNYEFQGIVFIETFDKNYKKDTSSNYLKKIQLQIPVKGKEISKNYVDKSFDRIPDYRYQLLWKPNLWLETNKRIISFYTSDVKGIYEVLLEGFNNKGVPVLLKTYFTVE